MTTMINGRTPEEIKKGLECYNCKTCPYKKDNCGNVDRDALAYIQQLEREHDEARNDLDTISYANTELHSAYEAMKRERDAAVEDIPHTCSLCANEPNKWLYEEYPRMNNICWTCIANNAGNWQWRGVQDGSA